MAGQHKHGPRRRLVVLTTLLVVSAVGVYLRAFVLLPGVVIGHSMEPTLHEGDYFIVDRRAYRKRLPRPGEIVAFTTLEREEVWVKRVVAGPGDVLALFFGTLYRNGRPVQEPYVRQRSLDSFPPIRVPKDHVFVLGDNRNNSNDSRDWGPLRREFLVGKVLCICWPRHRIRVPR